MPYVFWLSIFKKCDGFSICSNPHQIGHLHWETWLTQRMIDLPSWHNLTSNDYFKPQCGYLSAVGKSVDHLIYSYIPITPCQGHDIYPTSKSTATSQRQVSSQRSITHSYPTTSRTTTTRNFGLSPLHINPQHVQNVYPTLWGTSCFSFSFSISSGTTAIGVCPEVEWVATTTSCCANVGYMWVHLGTSHGKNRPKLRYPMEKKDNL